MDDKIGRNDPCPCGSGKKYKSCCINKPQKKPLPFKATLLSQPKQVDLMSRTFGSMIAEADKQAKEIEAQNPKPEEEQTSN